MTTEVWRLQSDAVIRSAIERFLPGRGGSILKTDLYDEAVSPGLYPILAERYERVAGIDIDPDVVAGAARRNAGLEAHTSDVRELPFEPGSFNDVLSNSTLDHLASRAEALGALMAIRRVIRPGGRLLITMDNPLNPLIALRNRLPDATARRVRGGFDYPAGWTCGPRALERLLSQAGFAVRDRTALLHGPRFLAARIDPSHSRAEARLARLLALERLERLPTRNLSGHFLAALAVASNA